jgi:hypothetical protein
VLAIGDESWNDEDILGTLPERLLSDVYIPAFGVLNFRCHPQNSFVGKPYVAYALAGIESRRLAFGSRVDVPFGS